MPRPDPATRLRSPSTRAVAAVAVGLSVVVGGLLTLLGLLVGSTTQVPVQLELVRIGLTVLLGTGGLFGLYLAWRRQRSAEITVAQAAVTLAHTEHDATERRVTELYTKSAEQLGSDKAPVRLA